MAVLWSWRRVAHLVVAVIGVGVMIWAAVALSHPRISCHGVEMHPGDECATSSFSQVGAGKAKTYEELLQNARMAQPLMVGIGALVSGFGIALLVQDVRRDRVTPSTASDRRPADRPRPG